MGSVGLESVSKSFGGARALSDASLTAHAGEIHAVIGENGAGKSTLMGVLSGRLQPDDGTVYVDGQSVQFGSPIDAIANGIRLVPQELSLFPDLSVWENVMAGQFPHRIGGVIDRRTARQQAKERLATLGIKVDIDARARALKVVDQVFVQIARALTPGARVLIADEPTAAMSGDQAERLLRLLRRVAAQGVAVMFISHKLDEVYRIADRLTVLRSGRTVWSGPIVELSKQRLVVEMTGREIDTGRAARTATDAPECVTVRELSTVTVRSLSFSVAEGEIVGVYGGAGSGRDEVGPALFGITPRAGHLALGCRTVRSSSIRDAMAAGVGYVPAERRSMGLVLDASNGQNISLASLREITHRGVLRRRRENALAAKWIDMLSIRTQGSRQRVGDLSGGGQQKVLLARWLARRPRLLVLDEPTRGVDVGTKFEIYDLLRAYAAEGMGIVVISSDAEEVSLVADRGIVLRSGRVAAVLAQPSEQALYEAAHELRDHGAETRVGRRTADLSDAPQIEEVIS